jgi:DNA-binding MarR family transcriptional regulator
MVSDFRAEKTHWDGVERNFQRSFEEQIVEAGLEQVKDLNNRGKIKLARLAKTFEAPIELVEEIAQTILEKSFKVDLEEVEFNKMVEQIRGIESIPDEGVREFKLDRLSRRFKISKSSMMNCYYKALINQTPFIAYGVEDLGQLCQNVKEWLVSGWIPKSVVLLLHAMGGAGKSLLLYELIECIAKGQPWNGYPVSQGRVLVLQSDEPVVVTVERMVEIRQLTNDHPVQVVPGWQVENMARLEAYLKEGKESGDPITFCMIDSVTSINRNTMISENDTEYARFMLKLNDFGDRYGCTFAVIHHSNSEGESRGTKALFNSASEVWGLTVADESSGERVLRVQKTRMGRPPGRYKLQFDEETYGFRYVGQEGDDGQEETAHTEKRIELWLNEDERYGVAYAVEELAHHLQLNKNTVRKVMREMWNKGLISRCPKGQNKTLLYYVGQRVSIVTPLSVFERLAINSENEVTATDSEIIDRMTVRGDQWAINSENEVTAPDLENIDRVIAKNDDFSLLKNPKTAITRSMFSESPGNREKCIDRPIDRGLIDPPLIETGDQSINQLVDVGDIVIADTSATWSRRGSTKIASKELPPSKKTALVVPINEMGAVIFEELRQPSRVLAIFCDHEYVKVRNQVTGRDSVFGINDVQLYAKT